MIKIVVQFWCLLVDMLNQYYLIAGVGDGKMLSCLASNIFCASDVMYIKQTFP